MSAGQPQTLQDLIRRRRQRTFVGRAAQLDAFAANLERPWDDPRRVFIFNVYGQGGVGKSTLLGKISQMAAQQNAAVALSDDREQSVPAALARLAAQLQEQDVDVSDFLKRYRTYRQKRDELEADPDAPQGLTAFLGRTATYMGLHALRKVPAAGGLVDMVDADAVAHQAGEWAAFVRRRLTNRDERQLVLEPQKVLTSLFVEALGQAAAGSTVLLMLDTYERTQPFLDDWLRDLLEGRYGPLPPAFLLVIAGRHELDRDAWLPFEDIIARMPLNPFSEEEARELLARRNIDDEEIVDVILKLSGGIPLLIDALAAQQPTEAGAIGPASGTAVARLLKWVDDPLQRQLALDAALPRLLNRDVIALLAPQDADVAALFSWLQGMPFTLEKAEGWIYHDVVRRQMLRHKRRESPAAWSDLHARLADAYEQRQKRLQLDWKQGVRDEAWRANALSSLYHRLCANPHVHLAEALTGFLEALAERRGFASQWAGTVLQAGREAQDDAVRAWGDRLVDGLAAYENDQYAVATAMFDKLLEQASIPQRQQAVIHAWRGETYRLDQKPGEALSDFDRAVALDPAYGWALARRAQTKREMGSYQEALQDYDRAVELDPERSWVFTGRGLTHWLDKSGEEALADFDRALQLDPEAAGALVGRGAARRLFGDYEDALADFDLALNLLPQSAGILAQRGETYRLMDALDRALQDLNRAIELQPGKGWVFSSRGQTYRAMGEVELALDDFNQAVELDPGDAMAFAERGMTNFLLEEYHRALEDFAHAVELDPAVEWVIGHRGETYRLAGEYEQAIADFDRAVEMDPDDSWTLAHRGETYRLAGQYEKALADLDRALELNPRYAWALSCRAETYWPMAQYEQALADFSRAIELDPEDSWTFARRGLVYDLLGKPEQAFGDYERAVELDPEDSWALAQRGDIHRQMKDYGKALADFDRALSLAPEEDRWQYKRALALLAGGQQDDARAGLQRAITLARDAYEDDPQDILNAFNLALYLLAAGYADDAYRQVTLTLPASSAYITQALKDLDELAPLLDDSGDVDRIRRLLQEHLS